MRDSTLNVKVNTLAVYGLLMIGIPLLTVVFSVTVPPLRNPVYLIIGALVGLFLARSMLNRSRFATFALVAGLVLAALCVVLVNVMIAT